jgi:hypothetical protein
MRALILLLCFAAWRGPLPWIHEHHAANPAGDVDVHLVRHLANYHTGHDPADLPWHVHFVVFWDGLPDEDCGDKSPHAQDPLMVHAVSDAGPALVSAWGGHAVVAALAPDAGLQCGAMTGVVAAGDRADSFLASLLRAAPLRAVTGVALC